jgi:Na+-transporting NADH:ubiquinone oxidoreductase subunit A
VCLKDIICFLCNLFSGKTMINIKKGLDLPISGKPEMVLNNGNTVKHVAVLGSDFPGLRPSMLVEVDDVVDKGQVLFTDKKNPGVQYTAPIAGKIVAINRGAKRAFQSLVIEKDPTIVGSKKFKAYPSNDLTSLGREDVQQQLVDSGAWVSFRTRPFSKTPAVNTVPEHIFVTAMDTNPLAGDPTVTISAHEKDFRDGLEILTTLTDGFVYVCKGEASLPVCKSPKVKEEVFVGKHPAGLAGTHIHFIHRASENHVMWSIGYQDVIAIGYLFRTGEIYNERVVSIAGPNVREPRLVRTVQGACVSELVANELIGDNYRVIAGSVLNGNQAVDAYDYLGRFHLQVSVIPEGNQQEFLGWIAPGAKKHSITRSYLSSIFPPRKYEFNTAVNGGSRAMVPIGNFERVMPLDIIPTMLLRSIEIGDTDAAKLLGCMELDEEDLALCTYVCPGKTEYGRLLRKCLTKIEVEG